MDENLELKNIIFERVVPVKGIEGYEKEGMLLVDYFAGKAMEAFLKESLNDSSMSMPSIRNVARDSYKMAIEMLKARKIAIESVLINED